MARVRRSAWLLFFWHEGRFVDIGELLRGRIAPAPLRRLYALSLTAGREQAITRAELDVLLATPSGEWVDAADLEPGLVRPLVESGLLLSDEDEAPLTALRLREERLRNSGWNLYAAAYHFLTRFHNVDLRGAEAELLPPADEVVRDFVAAHGPPPPPFRPLADSLAVVDLPLVQPSGGLYRALAERRTTRSFDTSRTLGLNDFALVLHQVFGCHGSASAAGGEIVTLKRTSPSGGGLHPIEAFPLVVHVEGFEPGLYHYDAERHALELLEPLDQNAASKLATEFVCGQSYFGSAHALVLFAARFTRSYWKYRRHPKAYASILMDAGHLSQTLYLLAAELGLGAFVTSVINDAVIDERLGLDDVDEGTVAACGLGVPGGRSPFDPVFQPFALRRP